ncbi:UNVERIFIED_ORG: exopolysaccharide transport family protein (plasmid) [Roseateles sp. XES5]|nr:exopolysaccharide transport family protein [Roseateles sp. XES5]
MVDSSQSNAAREDADGTGTVPQIDFAHLFSVLRNRFLMIVAITALFFGASVFLSQLLKSYFVSTTSILVDPEGSRVVENELYGTSGATEARTLNQQYILTSVKVLAAVVKSEGLADDPDFGAAQPYEPDADKRAKKALATLQTGIAATLNKASFVIDLSVTAFDPEKAARIANAIANTYIETRAEMNNGVVRQATTDLSAQLANLEKAVEDGDRAIQVYKAEHNLLDVGGRTPAEQQITETNTEINKISASIAENEALISELALARSNPDYLRSTPDSALTPAIIELRTRYHTAQEQESVLRSSFGERHPSLVSARARTQAVATLLNKQLKDFTTSLARNGEKLKSQREFLRKNLTALKASLNEADQSMVRLREMERKLASDRAVYESFLLRTRQLSGQERTISENPQIISVAQPPLSKAGPKRSLIIAGATLLGLLLGCGIALVRDRKLPEEAAVMPEREARPARESLLARLLSRFRRRRKEPRPAGRIAEEDDSTQPAADRHEERLERPARLARPRQAAPVEGGYADIARQLLLEADGQPNHCIVLYAPEAQSDASRTAFQLARAIAREDASVLLVDAEPEAGLTRQASAVGLPGLHDSISLQRIEGDFINPARVLGFWLMPAGRRSPRVSTRRGLDTGTLVDWLDAEGTDFDLVLVYAGRIDQPKPLPAVEMAAARFAVLASRFNRKATQHALSALRERGLSPATALVIGDADSRIPRAG